MFYSCFIHVLYVLPIFAIFVPVFLLPFHGESTSLPHMKHPSPWDETDDPDRHFWNPAQWGMEGYVSFTRINMI
jgi:hypothetical protein